MMKIIVAGIGPGCPEDITQAVRDAVGVADVVVGYKYYFQFVEPYLRTDCQCIDTGMKKERERAEQAFVLAEQGKTVVVISSGDAGIYGMAPLIYEMKQARRSYRTRPLYHFPFRPDDTLGVDRTSHTGSCYGRFRYCYL